MQMSLSTKFAVGNFFSDNFSFLVGEQLNLLTGEPIGTFYLLVKLTVDQLNHGLESKSLITFFKRR